MKNFMVFLLVFISYSSIAQECSINIARSAPDTRFIYNDNGSVKDIKTGLIWMRCRIGQTWNKESQTCDGNANYSNWQSTLTTVEHINDPNGNHVLHEFAGVKKWRLPNIKELYSLTEVACYSPAMNSNAFSYSNEAERYFEYLWSNSPAANEINLKDKTDGKKVMVYLTGNGFAEPHVANKYEYSALLVAE